MKTTNVEKKVIRKDTAGRGTGHTRTANPSGARKSLKAAADRQIAEIERTFTLHYEW
jgi:hypothetical protein